LLSRRSRQAALYADTSHVDRRHPKDALLRWKPDEQRLREAVRLYCHGVQVSVRD
jgi:hypothetical protein